MKIQLLLTIKIQHCIHVKCLTSEVIKGMLHKLCLGPVRKPDVVDILHEAWEFLTSLLELGSVMTSHDHTDPEVLTDSAEKH